MSLVDLGSEQTHKHIHKKELCSFLNPEKAAIFLKEALQDTNDSMIVGEISWTQLINILIKNKTSEGS